ncbi:MAG TPA: IPT/TIG domain-containing protein, partial [Puia sp.]|nr:IPT/TIG domain-containing protein [Puia sp.]
MKKLYALKENIVRITKLKAFSFILVNILSAQCLFAQQPFIRNFTPTSGVTGTTITIYGYLLTGVKSVSFGGDTAQSVVFINDSTITAIVGLGATGSVSVTTPGGTAQKSGFLFNPQQPVINYFSPTSGTNGTTVTITGRNFTGATAVSFGGTPASFFNVFSDTVINAIVASGATGNIAVTAPGGTGTIAGFIYTIPLPTISSFTPTSAGSGATVTITGTNLTGATAVSFGGVAASSFTTVSSATIKAVVSTGASGSISVTTPGGTAALNGFVFLLPPSISFFTPESGTPGTTIAIHGTHFIGATAVGFGGTPATSFIVVSDSLVTAILANGASGNVTVTTAQGTATAAGFTYIIPPPSVTTFAPFVGGTGTVVTITGTNFTGTTAVSFGGIAATSFFVVSSTTISAQVATGASGNVSVTTAGGTTSLNGFTYVPPPVINSVTPSTAINGDTIIIKGAYFTNATSVSFGGTAAVFTVLSDSEIVATVESGSTGNIVVTTPYGTGSISGFLFLSTPKIISFSPKSGLQGGIITITGISFTGATS